MRMICCGNDNRMTVQGIQALDDCIDDPLQFTQLMPVVAKLGNCVQLIKK